MLLREEEAVLPGARDGGQSATLAGIRATRRSRKGVRMSRGSLGRAPRVAPGTCVRDRPCVGARAETAGLSRRPKSGLLSKAKYGPWPNRLEQLSRMNDNRQAD